MAIQMRRGEFARFDPTKLLPGEFAIVLQGDDANRYGKGIYMCFAPGDVQRISTIEDISENIFQANEVLIGTLNDELREEFSVGEEARETAEKAREKAEAKRVDDERLRHMSDNDRHWAEVARAEAETARVAAEADRDERQKANDLAQAKNNADQLANNASALHARFTRLSEGEYDPETGVPTIAEPVNGVIYLVPSPDGDGSNAYVEWFWATNDAMSEGTWEMFGDPSAIPDPVTTDDVDAAFGDNQATGVRYMALSSMNYLAAKLKTIFAAISHKHKGSDIEAGTLPRTVIDESFEGDIAALKSSWDSVSHYLRLSDGCAKFLGMSESDDAVELFTETAEGKRWNISFDGTKGVALWDRANAKNLFVLREMTVVEFSVPKQSWPAGDVGRRTVQYTIPNARREGWRAVSASVGTIHGSSSMYSAVPFLHNIWNDVRVNFYAATTAAYAGVSSGDVEITVIVVYQRW